MKLNSQKKYSRRTITFSGVATMLTPALGFICWPTFFATPALGVSVKSVLLVARRLGFYFRSGNTKGLKVIFAAFAPGARHKRKCEGFCVCVVRHVCPVTAFNHSRLIIVVGCQPRMT